MKKHLSELKKSDVFTIEGKEGRYFFDCFIQNDDKTQSNYRVIREFTGSIVSFLPSFNENGNFNSVTHKGAKQEYEFFNDDIEVDVDD